MVQDHTSNEKVNQDKTAVRAAQALLDRGWGKAKVGKWEVATSAGQSYIEALKAVAEQVHSQEKKI